MARALVGVIVAVTTLGVLQAQSKPNFTGTWKMDSARSESAMQDQPIGPITLVISQSGSELRLQTIRNDGTTTVVYRLDGSEAALKDGKSRTYWQGDRLVTESEREIQGQTVTTKESRRLVADQNEMEVESELQVHHGYSLSGARVGAKGRDVYVRVPR